jgi:hypothetical protein
MEGQVGIYRRLRNHIRRYPFLLRVWSYAHGDMAVVVRRGVTEICIEGYPRSANSTTVRLFKIANPSWRGVGHHTHTIANVVLALRYGVPTVILLREPSDAVCSALIAGQKNEPVDELLRYVGFYRYVLQHVEEVVMVDFETALDDYNSLNRRVNARFGTSFDGVADMEAAHEQVRAGMEKRYEQFPEKKDFNMGLPSEARRAMKAKWKPQVDAHPMLAEARALYDRLLPFCEVE